MVRNSLIVGAGIAGLSLARALEQQGIIPDVVERQAAWNAGGTGLFLPGNASRAFSQLGFFQTLLELPCQFAISDFLAKMAMN